VFRKNLGYLPVYMKKMPQSLIDVYALALSLSLGFSNAPPITAWQRYDGLSYAGRTYDDSNEIFGLLAPRRYIDQTWAISLATWKYLDCACGFKTSHNRL